MKERRRGQKYFKRVNELERRRMEMDFQDLDRVKRNDLTPTLTQVEEREREGEKERERKRGREKDRNPDPRSSLRASRSWTRSKKQSRRLNSEES